MSLHPVFRSENTAVITGGASGIGLALATKCASYGMRVLITDINSSNLFAAQKSIKGVVDIFEMDVSKIEDYEKLKAKIEADFAGKISLLCLNAGIGGQGTWGNSAYFSKILSTNLYGVINGINILLPLVTTPTTPGSIIITGSKQGITNPPGNPAYNASKAAVKTLAEHLSFDLAKTSPHVSVHLLIPGWTFTGLSGNEPFAEVVKKKPDGAWTGEQVIEYLEGKMVEGKFYVVCPDGDVTEDLDRKRMLWGANDLIEGRPPLTRWRNEWKGEAEEWISKREV